MKAICCYINPAAIKGFETGVAPQPRDALIWQRLLRGEEGDQMEAADFIVARITLTAEPAKGQFVALGGNFKLLSGFGP